MHKLTKRANRNVQTDVRTDPNYEKDSLLKTIHHGNFCNNQRGEKTIFILFESIFRIALRII